VSDLKFNIEVTPPDISAYRAGNTGIDYVTTFSRARSGAACRGAGPDARQRDLRRDRDRQAVSRQYPAAQRQADARLQQCRRLSGIRPRYPIASRYVDEDFNRLWSPATLDGPRNSAELTRARTIRPIVEAADYLLDLHSMQYATAPLMLAGLLDKSRALARQIGIPELIMCDAGHAAGPRMRDYGGFGDPASPKTALLIEAGQHWEKRAAEVATDVMLRFLIALGTVTSDDVAALGGPDFAATPRQRVIEVTQAVTITGNRFEFVAPYIGLEVIEKQGSVLGHDDDKEVRTPYDNCVLIMPSRRLVKGQTAVRLGRYVD
jgi:hypothetical protein